MRESLLRGEVDARGAPPRPPLRPAATVEAEAALPAGATVGAEAALHGNGRRDFASVDHRPAIKQGASLRATATIRHAVGE